MQTKYGHSQAEFAMKPQNRNYRRPLLPALNLAQDDDDDVYIRFQSVNKHFNKKVMLINILIQSNSNPLVRSDLNSLSTPLYETDFQLQMSHH